MFETLQTKISEYQEWRSNLTNTISAYRDWLAKSDHTDAVHLPI